MDCQIEISEENSLQVVGAGPTEENKFENNVIFTGK